MRVLAIEGGIGSMLIPSKEMGFDIIGNIESRNDFYTGTFEENFPSAFMEKKHGSISGDIDLIVSHPKCGSFSSLNSSSKKYDGDHLGFKSVIRGINGNTPKFFLIDNLPKALLFYPLTWWADQLPDYDVTVEFIHNYGYGNVQKNRDRVFIIGSLKTLKYVFIPGEEKHNRKVRHVLRDLPESNNEPLGKDEKAPGFQPYTVHEARRIISSLAPGKNVYYKQSNKGFIYSNKKIGKSRIGMQIIDTNKPAPTITGQLTYYRADTKSLLTCRERARIQGIPDWFIFVTPSLQSIGVQTGKCIPVEFVRFFTKQISDFLDGKEIVASGKRSSVHDTVTLNRISNCGKNGHSNMVELCRVCYGKCKHRMI